MALSVDLNPDAAQLQQRIERFHAVREGIMRQVREVIVGQDEVLDQVLIALFVGGHCLMTGMPGTAKTLMVRTIAEALGLEFRRIQFTPDLMPSDITGTDIIEEDLATGHRKWTFVEGPIFGNVLLADEINRTPPKTQSALLEAMQERSCTVRGHIYQLPAPFFVLATQNPIELEGTYPLPEAQLDRFLFNSILDYLSADDELKVVDLTTATRAPKIEVVTSAEEGGASLGILSGFVAGNFSGYYLGLAMVALMSVGYLVSLRGLGDLMIAAPVFAFGLVAFGFLGMGPVTIAVDSYGPVTDNAQSVYELSQIETIPNIKQELKKDYNMDVNFERAKDLLEANDGAGNTFKATAKPVLIGTAVVGATTMIFSIIMALTKGITENVDKLSLLHAPFFLGLVTGGAMIYWFTGASTQAVTTGAYRAVEFIKANINLESAEKASVADSKKVVEICTKYAQKGMLNIFIAVFFATLAFAFVEPFFFIGYLISIAIFGLYQAIFMADAGAAWDNAKKIVEVELKQKGTPLHDATVVGDTVGDPFKDTSSVALNPVIKFTTLFGLLAVELAVKLTQETGGTLTHALAAAFFLVSYFFVYRSFYGMRIKSAE